MQGKEQEKGIKKASEEERAESLFLNDTDANILVMCVYCNCTKQHQQGAVMT